MQLLEAYQRAVPPKGTKTALRPCGGASKVSVERARPMLELRLKEGMPLQVEPVANGHTLVTAVWQQTQPDGNKGGRSARLTLVQQRSNALTLQGSLTHDTATGSGCTASVSNPRGSATVSGHTPRELSVSGELEHRLAPGGGGTASAKSSRAKGLTTSVHAKGSWDAAKRRGSLLAEHRYHGGSCWGGVLHQHLCAHLASNQPNVLSSEWRWQHPSGLVRSLRLRHGLGFCTFRQAAACSKPPAAAGPSRRTAAPRQKSDRASAASSAGGRISAAARQGADAALPPLPQLLRVFGGSTRLQASGWEVDLTWGSLSDVHRASRQWSCALRPCQRRRQPFWELAVAGSSRTWKSVRVSRKLKEVRSTQKTAAEPQEGLSMSASLVRSSGPALSMNWVLGSSRRWFEARGCWLDVGVSAELGAGAAKRPRASGHIRLRWPF